MWNLIKKELRELLTKSTLVSIVVVIVMFMALGSFIGGEVEEAQSIQAFGYIDATDAGDGEDVDYAAAAVESIKVHYVNVLEVDDADEYVKKIEVDYQDTDAILAAMEEKDVDTVVIFLPDFNNKVSMGQIGMMSVYWNQNDTGVFSALDTVTAQNVIGLTRASVTAKYLSTHGTLTPDQQQFIQSPVVCPADPETGSIGSTFLKGELHENVSPDNIYGAMSQQTTFIPIVIMLIITMIGSILISSMGNEKENKTLETLLTLPISRTTVVAGKLIGSAIAGIVMGAMYMFGMYFYINGLTGSAGGSVTMADLGLSLGAVDWVIVVACMFFTILCALGMCMVLGAFAKNYKAAQMYIMPISVLALIPMFVTMFANYAELPVVFQGLLFLIPFTHPMMVIQNLVFGETLMVTGGLIYLAVFACLSMYITIRLYKSDILLTGFISKKGARKKSSEE